MNKRKIIIILLIIVSLASILWIYFKTKQSNLVILPTPVPKIFELSGVAPRNGVDATIIPTTAIEFTFNKSINPNTLVVAVEPQAEIQYEASDNRRSVFVRAIPSWEVGVDYKISINVNSEEGETIPQINYQLRLKKITESDMVEIY